MTRILRKLMVPNVGRFSRMDTLGRIGVVRAFFQVDIKYLEVGVLQLISPNACDSRTTGVGNSRPKVRQGIMH
jgi:hypothetical protein